MQGLEVIVPLLQILLSFIGTNAAFTCFVNPHSPLPSAFIPIKSSNPWVPTSPNCLEGQFWPNSSRVSMSSSCTAEPGTELDKALNPSSSTPAETSAESNGKSEKKITEKKSSVGTGLKTKSQAIDKKGTKTGKQKNTKLKNKKSPKLRPITDLVLGSLISGRVSGFSDFGAFIKIGYDVKQKGVAGYALLHRSQVREDFVKDIKKHFRVGQDVKNLRVISVNYAKGEVGVSLRPKRPSRQKLKDVEVGSEVEGTVTKVMGYGAFVDIGANANALVHISRISQKKIENVRNWVNEGDVVTIRIIGKDIKKNTLAASMLDKNSDMYLNKRDAQKKRMRERSGAQNDKLDDEMEIFEDAIRDLEEVFGTWDAPSK